MDVPSGQFQPCVVHASVHTEATIPTHVSESKHWQSWLTPPPFHFCLQSQVVPCTACLCAPACNHKAHQHDWGHCECCMVCQHRELVLWCHVFSSARTGTFFSETFSETRKCCLSRSKHQGCIGTEPFLLVASSYLPFLCLPFSSCFLECVSPMPPAQT